MRPRAVLASALLVLGLSGVVRVHATDEVVRRFGRASVRADLRHARPGGVIVVSLAGTRGGASSAILDGRRAPFFGGRALVPVSADARPGARALGVEIRGRGVQRVMLPVTIAASAPAGAARLLPPAVAELIGGEHAVRDGRRLLAALRTTGPRSLYGPPLMAPVALAPSLGFGAELSYVDQAAIGPRFDGLYGETHRGLDYDVAVGTTVRAPGAGTVTLAEPLALAGLSLVLDHGQGLVSVLCHLSRLNVRSPDVVAAGTPVALSGDSGIAATPHVHWGLYLHGVAVDPLVFLSPL